MPLSIHPFEINESLWLVDTGLYHLRRRTLVLADLHLGYEEAMRGQGVMLPQTHFTSLLARLRAVFASLEVSWHTPLEVLILNGDLRHTFGPLNVGEWRELNAFFEHIGPFARRLVVVQGNHDPALNVFATRYPGVSLHAQFQTSGWLYAHGDKLPDLSLDPTHLAIGHEHPALSLRDPVTGRQERFKVFLQSRFQGRALWVLPSCNALIHGTDLTKECALSPLLHEADWSVTQAYVRDDAGKIYPFGTLNQLI